MLTPFLFAAIGEYAFLFFGVLTVATIPVVYFCASLPCCLPLPLPAAAR